MMWEKGEKLKMDPKKVIVWGIGNDYEMILNQLMYEILKKNLTCEALVCREKDIYADSKDGCRIIKKSEIMNFQYDYIVISSSQYFIEIKKEIMDLGIAESKVIDGSVFKQPLFDFGRYVSLLENPITILSDDCWGGVCLS